ncbi:Dyp-type peroxidase [Spiractinospora alimapuensis]|uniref:Dyp-type peroxidase n=1 Tax=Spiractinospora alimapuensis TaxID=2820884 RepID=UPI001F490A5A|nr:Dyp-type peroxidase [Spiractinospora alimapuensis]QVQ50809.1 Dyp-type peroxidase [Spiractinospora alimapuensis]
MSSTSEHGTDEPTGEAQGSDAAPSPGSSPIGRPGVSRRRLLFAGAAAGAGAAALVGADAVARRWTSSNSDESGPPPPHGSRVVDFHGEHQAGVATPPQAHARFLGIDLNDDVDADGIRRMLGLLSDDAAKLTAGQGALADSEPELALVPAALTVTFGFGEELVRRVDPDVVPSWLRPLPDFDTDDLHDEWTGGDLLLQVCADDPLTVAHASRMLTKDVRAFGTVRWAQDGFRRSHGAQPAGTTMRNLFGQIDGTVNAAPDSAEFETVVWDQQDNPDWLAGGTGVVIRRIAMDLDGWDRLDRPGREDSVGRRLSDGAPLTGDDEHDEPDFDATTPLGFPRIAEYAHIRRARTPNAAERIFRRAYNYQEPDGDSGLLFVSYQSDVDRQFVPIQRRLDELDLLNEWITPIGSAVFAVPPGCPDGGFVGQTLFDA